MSPDLGIVVPAYRPDVDRLTSYVRALDDRLRPKTIRIELDTPSRTVPDELLDLPVSINAVARRRGKGAAITAGFEALETDVLAFVDADGSTPVDSFANVVAPVQTGDAALAVGSRRHPDANVTVDQSPSRQYLGDVFVWLAQHFLPVSLSDYQCGAKAISAAAWDDVRTHIREAGFAWDIELIALTAVRYNRVVEVPVEWTDQPDSTVDPAHDGLQMLWALARIHHRVQFLRGDRFHRTIHRESASPLVEHVHDNQVVISNA